MRSRTIKPVTVAARSKHGSKIWLGWYTNGEVLRRAAADFDAFVTVDRNLAFQQNQGNLPIPVIVIHSRSDKLKDIDPTCLLSCKR